MFHTTLYLYRLGGEFLEIVGVGSCWFLDCMDKLCGAWSILCACVDFVINKSEHKMSANFPVHPNILQQYVGPRKKCPILAIPRLPSLVIIRGSPGPLIKSIDHEPLVISFGQIGFCFLSDRSCWFLLLSAGLFMYYFCIVHALFICLSYRALLGASSALSIDFA